MSEELKLNGKTGFNFDILAFFALILVIVAMCLLPFYYAIITSFESGSQLLKPNYLPEFPHKEQIISTRIDEIEQDTNRLETIVISSRDKELRAEVRSYKANVSQAIGNNKQAALSLRDSANNIHIILNKDSENKFINAELTGLLTKFANSLIYKRVLITSSMQQVLNDLDVLDTSSINDEATKAKLDNTLSDIRQTIVNYQPIFVNEFNAIYNDYLTLNENIIRKANESSDVVIPKAYENAKANKNSDKYIENNGNAYVIKEAKDGELIINAAETIPEKVDMGYYRKIEALRSATKSKDSDLKHIKDYINSDMHPISGFFKVLLQNYDNILFKTAFLRQLWNSIFIATITVSGCLLLSLSASFALARIQFRGRAQLLMLILAVSMFPQVAVLSGMFTIVTALDWFNKPYALIFAYTLFSLPFTTWILTTFMRELPLELEEASIMDGASPWQTLFVIFLPLMWPALVTTGLLAFIGAFNEFLFAITFTSTPEAQTATVGIANMKLGSEQEKPLGLHMAGSTLVVTPILILVLMFQKRIVSGLTAGAVKG